MSVRINLEIGHEASIRTKRTPEGFTHDWEVFVRGCDGAEIQYFVEKVVFHLHETFPKPKRVIKEPPYSVKESGYAGFNLPIEIYLRNKDDPKKVKFHYDLHLQPSGPAIIKVQKEKYVFNLPNDDFKHKLLKGGGSIANVSGSQDNQEASRSSSDAKNELTNKPKLGGSDSSNSSKKHKVKLEEPRISNSFQDLFGTPITKTTKVSTELKTVSKDVNKNSSSKPDKVLEKEKNKDKSKYSPNKEKERDREKSKEKSADLERKKDEKKNKDRNRDRAHSKEKSSKRDRSPRPNSPSPKHSPKRISSPKRLPSPPPPPVKQHKEKEDKRIDSTKEKKEKIGDDKNEKKSKKRDKDKEHKEAKQHKEAQKPNDHKEHKSKEQKQSKDESPSPQKIERKLKDASKEPLKESELSEKNDKVKTEKTDEKPKHKHKKKDKDRKDKDKDKSAKDKLKDKLPMIKPPEPVKETREEKVNLFSSPKTEEKSKKPGLFSEAENDSSNSSLSSREEPFAEPADKSNQPLESKKPKIEPKREKSKKSKDKKAEKDEKKRKRKSERADDEPVEKIPKEEMNSKLDSSDSEQGSNPRPAAEVDKENQENPEDYMQILRELQHKIMTLQDNTELQKVVQLIAKTGRYEVSARTFDFDLCLLEKSTVRQLQEFFATTS